MKRRVFSKTTSFHEFYQKKKKEQNGVVLKDTVPLSSPPPEHCSGEEGKRGFCLNFVGPSLAWSPPTEHTGRPPAVHLPENRGEPNLGSRAQWPTSRLLPIRTVKSHALGSINRPKNTEKMEEETEGRRKTRNREKRGREPEERKNRRERIGEKINRNRGERHQKPND